MRRHLENTAETVWKSARPGGAERRAIARGDAVHPPLSVGRVILGGGNVKKLQKLPPGCRASNNANAFIGGFRLWPKAEGGR